MAAVLLGGVAAPLGLLVWAWTDDGHPRAMGLYDWALVCALLMLSLLSVARLSASSSNGRDLRAVIFALRAILPSVLHLLLAANRRHWHASVVVLQAAVMLSLDRLKATARRKDAPVAAAASPAAAGSWSTAPLPPLWPTDCASLVARGQRGLWAVGNAWAALSLLESDAVAGRSALLPAVALALALALHRHGWLRLRSAHALHALSLAALPLVSTAYGGYALPTLLPLACLCAYQRRARGLNKYVLWAAVASADALVRAIHASRGAPDTGLLAAGDTLALSLGWPLDSRTASMLNYGGGPVAATWAARLADAGWAWAHGVYRAAMLGSFSQLW